MKRADAEQLATSYCMRNIATAQRWNDLTRPAAERKVLAEATAHYGSALTTAARRRIRTKMREARPKLSTRKGSRNG